MLHVLPQYVACIRRLSSRKKIILVLYLLALNPKAYLTENVWHFYHMSYNKINSILQIGRWECFKFEINNMDSYLNGTVFQLIKCN